MTNNNIRTIESPIWEPLMLPIWLWALVLGISIILIYLLKGLLKVEEEYAPPSVEDRLRQKIIQLRFFETVTWIFMAIGFIIYIYGIVNSSPLVIFFIGSGLVIVGYVVATYYRKQRHEYQKELEEK